MEHSAGFGVMRNGLGSGMPFVAMSRGSGGLSSELTGDDVLSISRIYGYDPSYRNVFVSSQLLRNGQAVNNNIDHCERDQARHHRFGADRLPVLRRPVAGAYI
jgi:hypothetical protein